MWLAGRLKEGQSKKRQKLDDDDTVVMGQSQTADEVLQKKLEKAVEKGEVVDLTDEAGGGGSVTETLRL